MGIFNVLTKLGGSLITYVEELKVEQDRTIEKVTGSKSSNSKRSHVADPKNYNWTHLGMLDSAELSQLSTFVGLYRATLDGEIVYVGRAVEFSNGGLRKRLSDYTRNSDSSRKHASGQSMNKHRADLSIDVLITGSDQEAAEIAKVLERHFIKLYNPIWNKR